MIEKRPLRLRALLVRMGLVALWAPAVVLAGSESEFAETLSAVKSALVENAGTLKPARIAPEREEGPAPEHAIVRDQTTLVKVQLNSRTVKCSRADYSEPMLKILVPELAELTVLNHRNAREGAPCVAAGVCGQPAGPEDILRPGQDSEGVPFRIILKKSVQLDGAACRVELLETVSAVIRGVPFYHERRQAVADRTAEDCR